MQKKILITLIFILIATFYSPVIKAVGSLIPSGTQGDATQYTLNDIYNKITSGVSTSTKSGVFTKPESVTATFRTLTEIYETIPEWLSLSSGTTTFLSGYYEADNLSNIDTDLIASNIVQGINIFGINGTVSTTTTPLIWSTVQAASNWSTAVSTCANLTEGSFVAGTWRLPTVYDYYSIVDYSLSPVGTSVSGFVGGTNYWTSTNRASDPSFTAWYWSANPGNILSSGKSNQQGVRCVR